MKHKLENGDVILSLTDESENEWQIVKNDKTTITFDYGVISNTKEERVTLYNNGMAVASIVINDYLYDTKRFIKENILC